VPAEPVTAALVQVLPSLMDVCTVTLVTVCAAASCRPHEFDNAAQLP